MCITTWHGTDSDLETSLLEYNMVCKYNTQNKEYDVIVPSPYIKDKYDERSVSEHEVNTILDDLLSNRKNSFLNWLGEDSVEDWITNSFATKFRDLCTFFGSEDIVGADEWPITLEEVCEKIELELTPA